MGISSYSTYSDSELLVFLHEGDKKAFEEFYNRYHKPIYRYLVSLVKVPEIAEDLVHEIFLKLWDIREKLVIKENFKGYLFWMCHNKAADTTKKIAGERMLKDRLLHYYQNLSVVEHHTLEQLQRYDNLIEEALNSLSPQRRKVYELCKRQGKSYQEAAEELQISTHTVKEHMSSALATLRDFLRQQGEFSLALIVISRFF
jgi:RNA polymerase sigma-70 factor (ECF subfamily)